MEAQLQEQQSRDKEIKAVRLNEICIFLNIVKFYYNLEMYFKTKNW